MNGYIIVGEWSEPTYSCKMNIVVHVHDDEILKTYTKMDIWMEGHTRSVLSDLTGLNLHSNVHGCQFSYQISKYIWY